MTENLFSYVNPDGLDVEELSSDVAEAERLLADAAAGNQGDWDLQGEEDKS